MPPYISCNVINWTINFAFITANNLIWNLYDDADEADAVDDDGIKLLARSRWITAENGFLYAYIYPISHVPFATVYPQLIYNYEYV